MSFGMSKSFSLGKSLAKVGGGLESKRSGNLKLYGVFYLPPFPSTMRVAAGASAGPSSPGAGAGSSILV